MYVGNARTAKARWTTRSRSKNWCQTIFSLVMKAFQVSSSLSELTLIITNELSFEYFLFRSRNPGSDATQGGHHVPQKSSTTTLPFRSSSAMYSPSEVVKEKSGANGSRARRGFSIS